MGIDVQPLSLLSFSVLHFFFFFSSLADTSLLFLSFFYRHHIYFSACISYFIYASTFLVLDGATGREIVYRFYLGWGQYDLGAVHPFTSSLQVSIARSRFVRELATGSLVLVLLLPLVQRV